MRDEEAYLVIGCASALDGAHYTYAGQLHNSVIVIIRHAEKPADGDGLAPAGEVRANGYVDYFKNFTLDSKPIHFRAIP
jgi:hypothetical protein